MLNFVFKGVWMSSRDLLNVCIRFYCYETILLPGYVIRKQL
jgi:hypothetical protein